MVVICPADGVEAEAATKAAYEHQGPVYLRMGRLAVPVFHEQGFQFQIGKGEVMREGNDVAIIANGLMVNEAVEAAKVLAEEGINARVIDMSIAIKPCDREAVIKAARETGRIITVEEHSRFGGLGGMVAEIICEEVPGTELTILGIPDENAVHGTDKEIRHYYGLDAEGIYNTVKE
jgi:transketolase